jgi:hypothetical protein
MRDHRRTIHICSSSHSPTQRRVHVHGTNKLTIINRSAPAHKRALHERPRIRVINLETVIPAKAEMTKRISDTLFFRHILS